MELHASIAWFEGRFDRLGRFSPVEFCSTSGSTIGDGTVEFRACCVRPSGTVLHGRILCLVLAAHGTAGSHHAAPSPERSAIFVTFDRGEPSQTVERRDSVAVRIWTIRWPPDSACVGVLRIALEVARTLGLDEPRLLFRRVGKVLALDEEYHGAGSVVAAGDHLTVI